MAIISKRNIVFDSSANLGHAIWFTFMEDLITQGWRVLGSGDGVTFENSGQKVAAAAFGTLLTPAAASLNDGETFTIDDGKTSVTFEFDTVPDGVGGGNVAVDISALTTAAEVRDAIVTAINGSALAITAEAGSIAPGDPANTSRLVMMNDATGAGGNTTSSETVTSGDFILSDMTGGGVAAGGSGGAFHLFTSAPAIDQTSPWTGGLWANVNPFAEDELGASWIRFATPADAEHYTEIVFQLQFNINPGTDESLSIIICRGDQRFDNGATQWQRPRVNQGTAISLGRINGASDDPDDPQPNTAFWLPSSDGYVNWFIGDSDDDYDFFLWSVRAAAFSPGEVFADFGRFRVVGGPTRSDNSADPDPYVWLVGTQSSTGNTNHNFSTTIHTQSDITASNPERLEDWTTGGSQIAENVATFGLGDPAIPTSVQGHYEVGLMPWGIVASGTPDFFIDDWNQTSQATGRTIVSTLVGVGRAYDSGSKPRKFFKGVLKNDLLGWSSKVRDIPTVQRGVDVADPFRVAWGRFHLYWGAEERALY